VFAVALAVVVVVADIVVADVSLTIVRCLSQYINSPVSTICMGQACSMASLILAAGATGKRYALPNARVMLHQPSGGAQVRYSMTERCSALKLLSILPPRRSNNDKVAAALRLTRARQAM